MELKVHLEGDGCWPDLLQKQQGQVLMATNVEIAALSGGMQSGKPSVMLRLDLPGGKTALAEVSMRLFLTTNEIIKARYGAETKDKPGDDPMVWMAQLPGGPR